MVKEEKKAEELDYIKILKMNFKPADDLKATYMFQLTDADKSLLVEIELAKLNCHYGTKQAADVVAKMTKEVFEKIITGKMTLQQAFMSGEITAKGNFKTLRAFDTVFQFHYL